MSEIKQHWQKIELNEILSISSKKFNPISNNENKKCVELEHLSQETGKLLGYTNSSEQQSIKNSFEEGQILFGKLRPYLKKFWKAEFEGVCSSEIWVMNGKKVKNDFLFYLVQTEKFNQIANVSSGSKMPRADWNYMSEIPFDIPPLKEQEKIAQILTTWDEAITKQTELLEAKELLKIALMQKLLSGEVRFSGFSDEWEEVRLSKIIKLQGGYAFKSEEFKKKGIPIIRISNISNNSNYMEMNDLIYYDELSNESNFLIKKNDLLIAMSGATTGKVSIYNLEKKAYLNQRVGLFKVIKPTLINYSFLIQFVFSNFFSVQLKSLLVAGAQPNISSKDIKSLKIKLPSLPEQRKIAEVLSLADDEINLLKNELEELKQQKKALMQKLLTGQVRVKV